MPKNHDIAYYLCNICILPIISVIKHSKAFVICLEQFILLSQTLQIEFIFLNINVVNIQQ